MAKTETPSIKKITAKLSRMGFKKTNEETSAKIIHTYLYDDIEVKKKPLLVETVKELPKKYTAKRKQ
ncbi:MAG: hypothetical protein HY960_00050 [Ignavibacteriae bacterium]|nr:hypothetical protein [Ignavibacteriota bacterium]